MFKLAAKQNNTSPSFQVTGLTPKAVYEFRVCAVNAAGNSPYSENSVPIAADHAPTRPKVNMGMLTRDVLAYVGETARVGILSREKTHTNISLISSVHFLYLSK